MKALKSCLPGLILCAVLSGAVWISPYCVAEEDISMPTDMELEAAIADDLKEVPPTKRPPTKGGVPQKSLAPARAARPLPTQPRPNQRAAQPLPQTPPSLTPPGDPVQSLGAEPELSLQPSPPAPSVTQDFELQTIVPADPGLSLAESFNAEKNPGKGTLTYKYLSQNEIIELGTDSGQFGFGLVFRHATLPEEFIREYGKIDVIQFSFGTLPAKTQGKVPEFGTVAIFSKVKPKDWMAFPLIMGMQRQAGLDFGLILFSSHKATVQRSDEEKLRDTFFSKNGQIRLMSDGPIKGLDVDAEGKKVSFKVQAMKMEIDAEMTTPFNAQKNQLTGAVQVPVYWPESPAALNWMRKFALRSLLASNNVQSTRSSASQSDAELAPKKKRRISLPKGM